MRKPPKRSSHKAQLVPPQVVHVTRARKNGILEIYLRQLEQGLLTSDDIRKMLTQSRQAIADWMKLGTPYARHQATAMTQDLPALTSLLDAAVAHELKNPIVTTQIH